MRRLLYVLLVLILAGSTMPVANGATLGTYGTILGPDSVGLSGLYGSTVAAATPKLIYQDNGATATVLDSTEAVFLSLNGDNVADTGDVQFTAAGPSTAGSYVTTPITTGLTDTTGGTALKTLLRFKDTLPAYTEGGPDGKFNPGETLFLDVNKNSILDTNDIILAGASPGSRHGATDTDDIFHKGGTECVYAAGTATPTTSVVAGMIRISTNCPVGASGSTVAGGDGDVGTVINTIGSVTISGGDATFTAGEFAWIGASPVASGHYRLVTSGSGAVGTVVDCQISAVAHAAADGDCATATTAITAYVSRGSATYPALAFPDIGRIDVHGDFVFGNGDRLYMDFDDDDRVSPGDVRAVQLTGLGFGTRPALTDVDAQAVLKASGAQPIVIYLDLATGTAGTVDAADPIALSLDGDDHFDFGDVPLTSVGGCTAGQPRTGTSTCGVGGTWRAVTTASPAGKLAYHDVLAPAGTAARGDGLYVHFGGGSAAVTHDVRITESVVGGVSYPGGQRLPASGSDLGVTLTDLTGGVFGTEFKVAYYDADGSGTETSGDLPYLELGAGNLRAGPHEARLHNQHSLTFGAYLSEDLNTHKDALVEITALAATATSDFAYFDLDGGATPSISDPILARVPEAACGALDANDVRMSAGTSSKAAGTILAADFEAGKTCNDLGSARFAYSPSTSPYSSTSTILLDIAGDNVASVGDVRISGSSPGTKLVTSDPLLSTSLTAIPFGSTLGSRPGAAVLGFVDVNGNAAFDGQENLIFDVDGTASLTAGDVLMTGTGGTTNLPTTASGSSGSSGGSSGSGSSGGNSGQTTTTTSQTVTQTTTVDPIVTVTGGTVTTTQTVVVDQDGNPIGATDTNTDGGESEPVPALGLMALLAALGAVVVAVRRRL